MITSLAGKDVEVTRILGFSERVDGDEGEASWRWKGARTGGKGMRLGSGHAGDDAWLLPQLARSHCILHPRFFEASQRQDAHRSADPFPLRRRHILPTPMDDAPFPRPNYV